MLSFTEKEFEAILKQNPALKVNQRYSLPVKPRNKGSKYHNKKVEVDGIEFDSQREANRYCELKIFFQLGEITDLELQPEFLLQEGFRKNGKRYRKIVYRADFRYRVVSSREVIVEDSKGYRTEVFRIKQKLFEERYPGLNLRLV